MAAIVIYRLLRNIRTFISVMHAYDMSQCMHETQISLHETSRSSGFSPHNDTTVTVGRRAFSVASANIYLMMSPQRRRSRYSVNVSKLTFFGLHMLV